MACLKIGQPHEPVPKPDFTFIKNTIADTCFLYEEKLHKVPELEELGIKPECEKQKLVWFPGGETKALQLLERRIKNEIESFKEGYLNPNMTKPVIFTSEISLSPYLR